MEIQEIQPGALSAGQHFDRLFAVVQRLRAPDGCPWDREQTPMSLRSDLMEEAWECVEAIGEQDAAHVQEELGDVFLLATMIAWMHQEQGRFQVAEVLDGISAKLIRRHPHVFGDAVARDSAEVLDQWARIKETVEGRPKKDSVLDQVKKSLPPLERAWQLQKKAAKAGFDWTREEGLWEKLDEEIQETREAWQALQDSRQAGQAAGPEVLEHRQHHLEEELGDLLFMVVNLCRFMKVDPNLAMQRCNSKFESRFHHVERSMKAGRQELHRDNIDAMEAFWQEAKALERQAKD